MPSPSYYFALYKRFQILGHVPDKLAHGRPTAPDGAFDLKDPASVFGASNRGSLLAASTTPADSPLWAVLNGKAMGQTWVTVGGVTWPAMPLGNPLGWSDFQTSAPAPKLVDTFADWIVAGKINDVPVDVLAVVPPPIAGSLDAGVSLFVCSVAGDDGQRPGLVPTDYWASSLIYLVDPRTGATVDPPVLAANSTYTVAAVIGNRGDTQGGRMHYPLVGNTPPGVVEAAAWVMVWNTGTSPAVELPALSNLDVTSTNGSYEVFSIAPGNYEVAGFRLDVQTAYDGLVAAIASSGTDLGGLTPEEWVHAEGAHLCVKVLVREQGQSWPLVSDTPFTEPRLAQKNLAPFAVYLSVSSPDPQIVWRNFMMGDVLRALRRNRLGVRATGQAQEFPLYLAVPTASFKRWFGKRPPDGFEIVSPAKLRDRGRLPFREQVVLTTRSEAGWLEIAALGKRHLAMSLGIELPISKLRPGELGEVTLVQESAATAKGGWTLVGGCTLRLEAHDPREQERALLAATKRKKKRRRP
jgi:hypothetical protein